MHGLVDRIGNETCDVGTFQEHLFYVAGRDEGLDPVGHEIDHVDGWFDVFVDLVELIFGLVIRDGPQAADEGDGTELLRLFDDEAS